MKRELRMPRLIQCRVPLPSVSRSTFFAKQAGLSSAFSVALLGSDSGHSRSWNQPQWLHRQRIQLLSSVHKDPSPHLGAVPGPQIYKADQNGFATVLNTYTYATLTREDTTKSRLREDLCLIVTLGRP